MSFVKRIMASAATTPEEISLALRSGGSSTSGANVTPDSAMKVSAVYACIRILSETVAQVPLLLYRRIGDEGRERATDHQLYPILHDAPNDYQTSFEFREMMQGHVSLRGNAYARKIYSRGQLQELLPLHPDNVEAEGKNGRMLYKITDDMGRRTDRTSREIFHLRGMSSDGYLGMSPIQVARDIIGMTITTDQHGAQLFKNGAKPGGILKHPSHFKDKATRDRVRDSWDSFTGGSNAGKTAVLEEGMEWTKVGMTSEDAQYLESRKFQISEIARIFRVPAMLLQHDDKTSTFASAEQFMLSFIVHTMTPWFTRWEQAIRQQLLAPEDRQDGVMAEFLMDGLLRGDTKSRYEAYASAIDKGWLLKNEVRVRENLDPIDGLDEVQNDPNSQE